MLIKICGMTSKEDIDICNHNGVDIVGFLLQQPSKKSNRADMLGLDVAKELIEYVPLRMKSCLLIHLKDIEKVILTIRELNPDMIQIQEQSNLLIEDLRIIKEKFPHIRITKTFYMREDIDILTLVEEIKLYIESNIIDYVLIDSTSGGSGKTHDWKQSSEIVSQIKPFPVILAGGLNSENIKDAILEVNPFGVDVMTGVSNPCHEKSAMKVYCFINTIKEQESFS